MVFIYMFKIIYIYLSNQFNDLHGVDTDYRIDIS